MWKLTKSISLRILSVLSKVEPEPDLFTGSGWLRPKSTGSGSATLAGWTVDTLYCAPVLGFLQGGCASCISILCPSGGMIGRGGVLAVHSLLCPSGRLIARGGVLAVYLYCAPVVV